MGLSFILRGFEILFECGFARWCFERLNRLHRWGILLNMLCVIFWQCVVFMFVIFSPSCDWDRCMQCFRRMSLSRRFNVLCGTTKISQLFADVFPDVMSIFKVLFMLIFWLLKHISSPSLVAFFCMFYWVLSPAILRLFVIQSCVCFLRLPASVVYFARWGFKPILSQMSFVNCVYLSFCPFSLFFYLQCSSPLSSLLYSRCFLGLGIRSLLNECSVIVMCSLLLRALCSILS